LNLDRLITEFWRGICGGAKFVVLLLAAILLWVSWDSFNGSDFGFAATVIIGLAVFCWAVCALLTPAKPLPCPCCGMRIQNDANFCSVCGMNLSICRQPE